MNYTRAQAIRFLQDNSRGIIRVSKAVEISTAFAMPDTKLPVRDFNMQNTRGLIWEEGKAVGVDDLACAIVSFLGGTPVRDSPYIGTGKTAQHITEENCKLLQAMQEVPQ
jgi:hypothetical protein